MVRRRKEPRSATKSLKLVSTLICIICCARSVVRAQRVHLVFGRFASSHLITSLTTHHCRYLHVVTLIKCRVHRMWSVSALRVPVQEWIDEARRTVSMPCISAGLPGTKDGCSTYASSRDRLAAQTAFQTASTVQSKVCRVAMSRVDFPPLIMPAVMYHRRLHVAGNPGLDERDVSDSSTPDYGLDFTVASSPSGDSLNAEYGRWLV